MAESTRLVDLVHARIEEFVTGRASILASTAADLTPLGDFSRDFLSGGKRFRALFCYWGWRSVGGESAVGGVERPGSGLDAVVCAAGALEIFHAAALIHDDIIDRSDTRRGSPSAHRRFEAMHGASGWAGSAEEFGRASALLLGDLLLGWSDELLDTGLAGLHNTDRERAARAEFNRMRTEVTAGQYLDILEERAWNVHPDAEARSRARRVIVFKSAKYSVETPLTLGASMAGAFPAQLEILRAFGLPLGIAFQLRDDLLGVFGDPRVTGKPTGDDLREGKRTVMIALARQNLPDTSRLLIDELLGDPGLTAQQIGVLQAVIRDSGALDAVERLIGSNLRTAHAALDESSLSEEIVSPLRELADRVVSRDS